MPRETRTKYPGVYVRGDSIRIHFKYDGVLCRETLKGIPVSDENITWANSKRNSILYEIGMQSFDYRKHFPDSAKVDVFSPKAVVPTVSDALDIWIDLIGASIGKETLRHYKAYGKNYIKPKFGKRTLDSILQSEVKTWRVRTLGHLSNKTINDIMIPFRGIFDTAMADRVIEFNPLAHVPNLERDSADTADPFTTAELKILNEYETDRVNEKNAILFACFTGLRLSEWLALAWEDVDWEKRQVKISRSKVRDVYSVPKTKGSVRTIQLLDSAYDILVKQKANTFLHPKIEISVTNNKSRKVTKEKITHVFVDSITHEPFTDGSRIGERFLEFFYKQSGVRHRGANQARHTFASQLLTKGIAERWIAKQMGHTSIAMLEKHYGRWMETEMPEVAINASRLFNLDNHKSHANPTGIFKALK